MKNVLVLGAGKVGKSVAELLLVLGRGEYRVTIADRDEAVLRGVEANLKSLTGVLASGGQHAIRRVDVASTESVRAALAGQDYVICMLPFNFVAGIAEAANEAGVHYFDVTEDVETTDRVRAIADGGHGRVALAPQCGLAPGYVAIAAHDVARRFDVVHGLTLRVGALPQFPTNALKYNITWSADGVVNEYCEPCNAMLGGRHVKVPALEGLERFSFEGVEYEAFYTSGGVGTLIETLEAEGKVTPETAVAYKTIRYPGHRDLMKFLLQDLRLGAEHADASSRGKSGTPFTRALAVELLEHAVPYTLQDLVVVFINGIGMRSGRREQVNFKRIVRATRIAGRVWPAIELTTAAGVCGMVELHRLGKLPKTGLIRQEQCSLEMFDSTPFALGYNDPERIESIVIAGA
ncbi:MAG: saccharopine dehydrogenase NADP-binding domain-containing protein [Phycisphaeraceae bacterium]|nr:saccharopine dehydrogenase NADP-binding domain-containing protein [Phycisphaeraceae bacterium]